MSIKTTDNVTLKNVTGKKTDSLYVLEAAKPQIELTPRSGLLQKIRCFLPQMEEANKDLSSAPVMSFEVINCIESSSSDDSDTNSEEDDETTVAEQSSGLSNSKKLVQLDIDLFKSNSEIVSEGNIEAQVVAEVPLGFREPAEITEESPKKKTVEVLND